MRYRIPAVTAEQIVLTAIGAYYFQNLTLKKLEKWLGLSSSRAKNATKGASELNFITEIKKNEFTEYKPVLPLCKYLALAKAEERPVIFRQQLLEYDPFLFFKERLLLENNQTTAATQTKNRYNIAADWNIIQGSLSDWGTYAGIFASSSGGRIEIEERNWNTAKIWEEIIKRSGEARTYIIQRIGSEAADKIEREDLERLTTLLGEYMDLCKPPKDLTICLAGVADTIFTKLAKVIKPEIDLSGCLGIIQLFEKFKGDGLIANKHLGFGHLLGQLRNAVDHDVDRTTREAEWEIDMDTSRYAFEMMLSAIRSVVAFSKSPPQYIL
ncbi:hypothetical protein GX441_11935 [bacterium]|nr:hypothetical protein [bacterium]